ncbi:MAG: PilZ domain-containing protein [Pseudomonadota bacterium]|nr:PilZ domain-containing protein [Pseudomonadota bacterium]
MATRLSQYRSVAPALIEQRSEARHLVAVTRTTVRRLGATAIVAHLHDLSIYGCRVASTEAHPEGERVWLRLAGGTPIAATVVWCDAGFVGCRFDQPIARAMVRALTLPA